MPWHKMNRNRWTYTLPNGQNPMVTLQDAKSIGKGWRYCRGWYDGARLTGWVYLGPAVTTLEEAQAATIVLIRLES